MHTPIDDATWLADKTKRGNYSSGDGATTFRVPDMNGVQDGSVRGLYARGDGGGFYVPGTVFENGTPDATGKLNMRDLIDSSGGHFLNTGSAAQPGVWYPPYFGTYSGVIGGFAAAPTNTATTSVTVQEFALSRANAAFGRSALEVRGNGFAGVWIIRASGGFVAANTSWSVINEDAEMPPAATSADGGFVQSQYKVNGVVVAESRMRAVATVGGNYSTRITTQNVTDSKSAEWIFGDDGVLTVPNAPIHLRAANSDKAFRIDGFVRADSLFGIAAGAIGVMAAESNEIRLQNTGAGGSAGNYINWLRGNWYNGNWTIGGIRSSSTALQRVQMNITDGVGGTASYMFNPNGVAQATQWQSTSDRRVKSCIETIPNPLEVMRSLRGYSWYYEPYGTQGFGFMSDEAEKYFPGAVKTTDDFELEMPDGSKIGDVKSVDTYGIAAALHHEAILAMMDQIAELKAEIKKLKGE
ncbi:TPA: tail fiber domain-containing protein [Citrobacter amalonaticus]|nr:tail fiber domain-containing protein [Citrobacter amalonaticus]